MEWKVLLVPHDFSTCAQAATTVAAGLAKKLGARIELIHVADLPADVQGAVLIRPEGSAEPIPLERHAIERASEKIEEHAASLRASGVEVVTSVTVGDVPETIVRHAHPGRVDAIVMGTHGRTGISHLLIGSVAERVVRTARVPVVTIRGAGTDVAKSERS